MSDMGGSHRRMGGRLSGGLRNSKLAKAAVRVRDVVLALPRTAAARRADAQAEPAGCEAYALVSRAVLESEEAKKRNVELKAQLDERQAELAALRARLADSDRRRASFGSTPSSISPGLSLRPRSAPASAPPLKIRGSTPADSAVIAATETASFAKGMVAS
jgi:hypothetical protein